MSRGGRQQPEVTAQAGVNLASDVALEASDDFLEHFMHYLEHASNFLERMQDKVDKWHAQDIREMQERAAQCLAVGTASGPVGWAVALFGASAGLGDVVDSC
jgi:hypothetical protein